MPQLPLPVRGSRTSGREQQQRTHDVAEREAMMKIRAASHNDNNSASSISHRAQIVTSDTTGTCRRTADPTHCCYHPLKLKRKHEKLEQKHVSKRQQCRQRKRVCKIHKQQLACQRKMTVMNMLFMMEFTNSCSKSCEFPLRLFASREAGDKPPTQTNDSQF